MSSQTEPALSRAQIAMLAIRPKTLGAAIAPVLLGTALAYKAGQLHPLYAGLALAGALLIQIGTNLANDYFDFKKGADTEARKGPLRVTQAGLVTPEGIKRWFVLTFIAAFLSGIPLLIRGGWPILVIGLASIASGIWYTKGRYALAYTGLADVFALIFFGPVAVGGTYYVQALQLPTQVLWIGLAPGLIAMGLLSVNNLRDIDEDRAANKRTLAVRFGAGFARAEYLICMTLPALLPLLVWLGWQRSPWILLASLYWLPALPNIKRVFSTRDGPAMNAALARTGQLLLLYSVLFSAGWLLT